VPPGVYEPRATAEAVLHQVVRAHIDRFLSETAAATDGTGLPRFIEREFRDFLGCGQLERGFARVRCDACRFERLVPFSCKARAICPSCGGRHMAEQAAHLVDAVLPWVPVRQWVLTSPHTQTILWVAFPLRRGDGVANEDGVWADDDFLHEQAHDALAIGERRRADGVPELREEGLKRLGELQVPLLVERLRRESLALPAEFAVLCAECRRTGPQLVERQQLVLIGVHQPMQSSLDPGVLALELCLTRDHRWRCVQFPDASIELRANQRRVGDQPGHLLPDQLIELLLPDGSGPTSAVGKATMIGAETAIVLQAPPGLPAIHAMNGVATARAHE